MANLRKAFFAYPANPTDLRATIETAAQEASTRDAKLLVDIWPTLDILGAQIADSVRQKIANSQFLIADITTKNPNVYYEIGFAIGRAIPILPVLNNSYLGAAKSIQSDGFFDNIKYEIYENKDELSEIIRNFSGTKLLDIYAHDINLSQPGYILDTHAKTDFRNSIVSSVKRSKLFYRSFDPVESARFSTTKMIAEATASSGAVIPFLAPHIKDSERHNLRASFFAGMMHGLGRPTLLIQLGDNPVPADYREDVAAVKSADGVEELVSDFSAKALAAMQTIPKENKHRTKSSKALHNIWLGASAAENEFRTLERYFLETSEYIRTLKGDGKIVVGRKGSGKTAIFFMARDSFRAKRGYTVVDLKPESYELVKLREVLQEFSTAGVMTHTFSAFWHVLLLIQIAVHMRDDAKAKMRGDPNALNTISQIEDALSKFDIAASGDFTSRLQGFIKHVASSISMEAQKSGGKIPAEKLTNFVYGTEHRTLRDVIAKTAPKGGVICILFDNLDKGWPAAGIEPADVQYLRALIDALGRLQHEFSAQNVNMQFSVFLRNDIYELLVEETSDRGKEAAIRIDWNDREKLRLLVGKRIADSLDSNKSAAALWNEFFPVKIGGRDGLDYVIDHSLMRPRFLIDIIERAISFAINREHLTITEDDINSAIEQHAYYLVDDFGYEIRDASNMTNEIIDAFIGANKLLSSAEVKRRLAGYVQETEVDEAIRLLVWYGFLGVINETAVEKYIYDFNYSMRRMGAEEGRLKPNLTYCINDAFFVGLS